MATPIFAAALDVASSPSGCASCCIAEGLIPQGKEVYGEKQSALVATEGLDLLRIVHPDP